MPQFGPKPPVLWLSPNGDLPQARLGAGTAFVDTPHGIGISFTGSHAGLFLPDTMNYHLSGSLSIASWLYLNAYVDGNNSAPGAQVLFRGDDRSGNDPYHLTVLANGRVAFCIEGDGDQGVFVSAPIQLRQWVHVLGSFDAANRRMRLWMDGKLVAEATTPIRPIYNLDPAWAAGVGIGNIQAPFTGRHNQPLHGEIADLRLYDYVVSPAAAGSIPETKAFRD